MPKALLVGGPWDGDTWGPWDGDTYGDFPEVGGQFLELNQPILVDGHYQVREVVYQYVGVDDPESDEPLLVYEWICTTPPHPYFG